MELGLPQGFQPPLSGFWDRGLLRGWVWQCLVHFRILGISPGLQQLSTWLGQHNTALDITKGPQGGERGRVSAPDYRSALGKTNVGFVSLIAETSEDFLCQESSQRPAWPQSPS